MTMTPSKNPSKLRMAMILAAGYGTRMGQLTRDLPKPLLPLNGLRIIEVIIKGLVRQGIERIVINHHYFPEKIKSHLGSGEQYNVQLLYSEEPELLGSGGGVANAGRYFEGETILAVNADVLCDMDIQKFFAHYLKAQAIAALGVLPSRNCQKYTLVLYDDHNRLRGFLPKGEPIPSRFQTGIFTGYQILTPRARAYLKPVKQSIISELYRKGIDRGENITVFPFHGNWLDIGSRDLYEKAVRQIHDQKLDLKRFL